MAYRSLLLMLSLSFSSCRNVAARGWRTVIIASTVSSSQRNRGLFGPTGAAFVSSRLLHDRQANSWLMHERASFNKNFFGGETEAKHLDQVRNSVQRVLEQCDNSTNEEGEKLHRTNILDLEPKDRQNLGVARRLHSRLQALRRNGDCPRCWLQRAHCICSRCRPIRILPPNVRHIFLLMHHKEVGLVVDTAKLILQAFPDQCHLVVGGLGPTHQHSLVEMQRAMAGPNCLVLFPTKDARTFEELNQEQFNAEDNLARNTSDTTTKSDEEQRETKNTNRNGCKIWDIVVIDGTWAQARKLHGRYIPSEAEGGPPRVQLSQGVLKGILELQQQQGNKSKLDLSPGLQLRRHPIKWREISTLEATRLLLGDMKAAHDCGNETQDRQEQPWDVLREYQQIADNAAKRQLGPPR